MRLTDPFGLWPNISLTRIGYAALDLLGIIPGFDGCDGIKAGSRIIGNAGALIQSGSQAVESAKNLYDSYVKDGEVISWKNATDLITLGLSVAGMGLAGKSLAKDGKALKAVSQGNVKVKPAAVSNSTASNSMAGRTGRYKMNLQLFAKKSGGDNSLSKYNGFIINDSMTKKGIRKTEYLFQNRSDAMNYARNMLGYDATRIYNDTGKWIGWSSSKGKVYWGHGDWGQGLGKSTFPHLNYDIGMQKGHLFLKDKIINRGEWEKFSEFFQLEN